MMSKLGSQMEQLLNASQPKPQPSPVADASAGPTAAPAAVAAAPEVVELTSQEQLIEKLRDGRQSPTRLQTPAESRRAESPQPARPTPERATRRDTPQQQQQQQQQRPQPASTTTANVVAKIHSLALLLDPQGLDAAVAELQQMQMQQQQAADAGGARPLTVAPPLPMIRSGEWTATDEDGEGATRTRTVPTSPVASPSGRMRLAQTKRTGPYGGRRNGSKMFDSCPDMSTITKLRHTVAAASSAAAAAADTLH
jgi:hypothetical protein